MEDLLLNPRTLSLDYYTTDLDIETPSGKGHGLGTLAAAGFIQSADGNRLNWQHTKHNLMKLLMTSDLLAGWLQYNRIQDDNVLFSTSKSVDIGPKQIDTGMCKHWKDKLEKLTCMQCSIQLMWLIINGLATHGNKSEFCVLNYTITKKMLNGYRRGLRLMCLFGFLRSKDGQRFFWKETDSVKAYIERHHEVFAEQLFCDCELTLETIAKMTRAEMQKEDENDERPSNVHLTQKVNYQPLEHEWDADMSLAEFRVCTLGLPGPNDDWSQCKADEIETMRQDWKEYEEKTKKRPRRTCNMK